MLQLVPTFEVSWLMAGDSTQRLRVPEPNVEALVHVLLFNRADEIHVEVERRGLDVLRDVAASTPTETSEQ